MDLQLPQQLARHAADRPGDVAIRQINSTNGLTITWRELHDQARTTASFFRARFPRGSVLMLCATNCPQFTICFLGALAAEMSIFPVAVDIARAELHDAARRSGAAGLIVAGTASVELASAFSPQAEALPAIASAVLHAAQNPSSRNDGPSMLLLSSGTTGHPKIVRRDGASLDAVSAAMADAIGFTPDDRVLASVPLCHSYGVEHGLLAPTWAGSAVHLHERFDPSTALAEIVEGRVSLFPGVPFMFETLCGSDAPVSRAAADFRAYSAGGALPASIFDQFRQRFGVTVSQLYGASEIGSVSFNDPRLPCFNPASVGRPFGGVEIRIVDPSRPQIGHPLPIGVEGHVAVRAPSMLSGYIDGEPPPLLDGYFLTGDLGRLDLSGALTLSGRIKLLIDIAGRKVNPLEVEQVLSSHKTVGECVVVPVRVSQTLNRLKAVLTAASPNAKLDPRELRHYARAHLSAYKVPRIFEVRQTLPRSPAGKVLRHLLSEG